MRNAIAIATIAAVAALCASCGLLRQPDQTIGYQIINNPNSQPTIQVASNGATAAGLYGTLPAGAGQSAPIVTNSVGGDASRSTDADLSAALQAGNSQSTQAQARDSSPQDTDNTPTDSHQTATSVGKVANAGVKPAVDQQAAGRQEAAPADAVKEE